MGSPRQEWARRLHRDSYKTLMPTADTQDGGLRGRVEAWTLTVGCVGEWQSDEFAQSVGWRETPRKSSVEVPGGGGRFCSLLVMCNFSSYAGCPHCKKVIPHFTATADIFKDDRKVRRPFFVSCPTSNFALSPVPVPSSFLFSLLSK